MAGVARVTQWNGKRLLIGGGTGLLLGIVLVISGAGSQRPLVPQGTDCYPYSYGNCPDVVTSTGKAEIVIGVLLIVGGLLALGLGTWLRVVPHTAQVRAQPVWIESVEPARREVADGVADRLAELDTLYRDGVLSRDEYARQRAAIIADI